MRAAILPVLIALIGCNNRIKEDQPLTADADGDGWAASDDCDDNDPSVYPLADEFCNGVDDDCDGEIDEDAVDAPTWYADGDRDGYGADESALRACELPPGYVEYGGDCDDGDTTFYPGAPEDDCTDPNDYNCDGSVGYEDKDGDGWAACEECDDRDPDVYPDADEYCDDIDNDCDGEIDEDDALDASTWYADADDDGYGNLGVTTRACDLPDGYVSDDSDCDDAAPETYPGADEYCDGHDDDCDGRVDEDDAVDAVTWYADTDADGYGDADSTDVACDAPSGFVADDQDCDDTDPMVFPGADEYCDGDDNDCDGELDEDDAVDASTWYADTDSDGYGDADSTDVSCYEPSGYVADATDCDDDDDEVYPGADEYCDGVDDDCDGEIDEDDALDASTWYADDDGDGYGDLDSTETACEAPSGYVSDDQDCDDSDASEYPGADEYCDGDDDDCDGEIDEDDAVDAVTWYIDADGDGYGTDDSTTVACDEPSGYAATDDDCNDSSSKVYPGKLDTCNGTDNDCSGDEDGLVTFWPTAGGRTKYDSTFAGGTASSPASVSISDDGTLNICPGTYYVELDLSASSLTVAAPYGSADTVLSGGDTATPVTISGSSSDITISDLTLTEGSGSDGGALYSSDSTGVLTLEDSEISDSIASNHGGGLYVTGGELYLDGVTISGNTATYDGGGVYSYEALVDVVDSSFDSNTAGSDGGGIYAYDGDLTVDGTSFDTNSADEGPGGGGGGIAAYLGDVSLVDSTFSANEATANDGGAVHMGYGAMDATDCEFTGNIAYDWGGVFVSYYGASVSLDECVVEENEADEGGAMYLYASNDLSCSGSSSTTAGFFGNSAITGSGAVWLGTGSTITSDVCDWGTSSNTNSPYDIESSSISEDYGDDESFSCTPSGCY